MVDATWAVIVARVANGAKSRLAGVLEQPERRRLALTMLSHVLDTSASSTALSGSVAVLDADPEARAIARSVGAVVVDDPGGMNAAVHDGVRAATMRGATSVIVLPADIPLIEARDLQALIGAAGNAPRVVVIGVSHDGQGTNALFLRPPGVIVPAFGPPSVGRHLRAGRDAGAITRVLFDLGLALDVDTPADLALYREGLRTAAIASRAGS